MKHDPGQVHVFNPVIGGYDKLAIEFGYTPIKDLPCRFHGSSCYSNLSIWKSLDIAMTCNADCILLESRHWCVGNRGPCQDVWPPKIAPGLQPILKSAEGFEAPKGCLVASRGFGFPQHGILHADSLQDSRPILFLETIHAYLCILTPFGSKNLFNCRK